MSFLFYNINGKRRFFDAYNCDKTCPSKSTDLSTFDVVCFSETWDISPAAALQNRQFFFSPASLEGRTRGRASGGLEVYSNPSLSVKVTSSSANHLSVTVNSILGVIFVYYKPDTDLADLIEDILHPLHTCLPLPTIVAGDFNLHDGEPEFDELCNLLSSFNISLCSDPTKTTFMHPNGGISTPDFVFCSTSIPVHSVTVHETADSDHFPLSLVIHSTTTQPVVTPPLLRLDREKCSEKLQELLIDCGETEAKGIIQSLNEVFSSSLVPQNPSKKTPPWSNPEIRRAKKTTKRLLHDFRVTSTEENKVAFLRSRTRVSNLIKKAKRNYWIKESEKLIRDGREKGISAFYKHAKPSNKNLSTQIPLEEWKLFYTTLYQTHPTPTCLPSAFPPSEQASELLKPFTLAELDFALSKQRSSAPSLEHISPVDCRELNPQLAPILLKIFNAILSGDVQFPSEWLSSVFFFLHKKGSTTSPSNYRSLAIENPLLKIFMWLLNRRLTDFLESSNLLPMYQFGFRKKRSAPSAVYLLQQSILGAFLQQSSREKKVFSCFVDFKKAFDLVNREILFDKMLKVGIPSQLSMIIMEILSNLSMHVRSNASVSPSFLSFNGVPQGDPLSPLLFSLFISDLPSVLKSRGVPLKGRFINHLMYADDLVLLATSPTELQRDINALAAFCDTNQLVVNVEKTKCLPFYRGRFDAIPTFMYKNVPLENVKEFNYLGITLTTQLSVSKHIQKIVSKCNSRIAQLFYKLKLQHTTLPNALQIFNTFILPIIDYGLPVWLPRLCQSSKLKVNAIFTKFLKRFFCVPYTTENSLVHYISNTSPLIEHLSHVHLKRFLSLSFPPIFEGVQFTPPDESPAPMSPPFQSLPDYFRNNLRPMERIPLDPDAKRALLYDRLDLFHFRICLNQKFHSSSTVGEDDCKCKFCNKPAPHFHHRECSSLMHLSPKSLLLKVNSSASS